MTDTHPASPEPGWYADPHGDQRWWDGSRWTEQTLPPPAPASTRSTATSGAGSTGGVAKVLLLGALALGVVLLIALVVLDVVLLVG